MEHKVERRLYLLAIALLGLWALWLLLFGGRSLRAEGPPYSEHTGIQVVPVQVGRAFYGIVMVDTIGKTLWVYEINRDAGHDRLRLLAARDWQYDQQLTDYNNADPAPDQVREILERFRRVQPQETIPQPQPVFEDTVVDE